MTDLDTPKTRIEQTAAELGLTMSAKFVPFSQSRNKDQKQPSLNWTVTISKAGRAVIETDYGAGCGHCPAYKASVKELGNQNSMMRAEAIKLECETGKEHRIWPGGGVGVYSDKRIVQPELADVISSLVMDASAIDAGGFDEWASDLGYDTDSRKAESIYRACIDIGLKLRAAIGEDGLTKLREACQDY